MTQDTTLANAMTALSQTITLASGTMNVDDLVAIEGEFVRVVQRYSTTQAKVQRGVNQTSAVAHAASVVATIGLPADFVPGPYLLPTLGVANTVLTAGGPATAATFSASITPTTIQATTYKSSDGTSGVTAGPFTAVTGITVKSGLVTALTGT
jgi:hypothetical protein